MSDETLAGCILLLSGMPSGAPWTEANSALYGFAMKEWSDEMGRDVVQWAVLNLKWRPSPVELREIAVSRHFPAPSPAEAREKIRHALIFYGGRGAAQKMDAFTNTLADAMGGWPTLSLCSTEEIDSRFPGAYAEAKLAHTLHGGNWQTSGGSQIAGGAALALPTGGARTGKEGLLCARSMGFMIEEETET